jgi:hypothetical protein
MSTEDFETEVPVTAYGAQRRADWYAGMQARSDVMMDMLSGAGQAGHADTSRQLRAAHQGLYPHMTPYDRGADAAKRQAVVGSAYGGRPLEYLGGTFDHADVGCSPAPARVDMRFVNQVGGPPSADAESGLKRWARENR